MREEIDAQIKFVQGMDSAEVQNLNAHDHPTFEEILNLAKGNHANFFARFQQYYPSFQSNLLQINPNLQNSELTLLAYIYLNFQTKEIAAYTFKSPKTIQNRKHLLRKKLRIASNEDIYVWLRAVCS
ncbi:helix-turn-helix transcriptional regulator [Sphingobacterium suaedae]|uniref:Helix-turn-helix transcriptional regulator n=1 Tax=Sphingobacterium suaedae TaxID=1686402 RepID=A0ABW5KLM5_9SPHI